MATEFDLIRRYRGAFTQEECKKLIGYIDSFEENKILTSDSENTHQIDNLSINISHDYNFPAYSQMSRDILPNFKPCVDEYLNTFSILKDYKFLLYDIKVKKIPICGGFHSWHFENGGIPYSQRKFVVQLYLNDDFEGGETEFLYQNRREIPKEGDVLIFPAGYTHTHRGNPPIGGVKYLITSWGLIQDND